MIPGRRPLRSLLLAAVLGAAGLECWTACSKGDPNADPKVQAGRGLYLAYCIACHSANPSLDGSLGPGIKGSSLELLKARVIHGTYPPGYTPKRNTKIMVKLPLTEEDVGKLHAYLTAP